VVVAVSSEGSGPASTETALLFLVDIEPSSRLWGWSRFVIGPRPLRRLPGMRFAKVLGSGRDGGFGLRPSPSVMGLFCVFDDAASAAAFSAAGGPLQAWRDRARESFTVKLKAFSCRGSWSGTRLAVTAGAPASGPVAALTRASIRPTHAAAFWRMEPPAERELADAPGCLLAAGIGEAPLLRQATFTIWHDVGTMDGYARTGAHQRAIEASMRGAFFSESMFVRFVPFDPVGSWKGQRLG